MAVRHPSSRISARQSTPQLPEPEFIPLFKPDEDAWKAICAEAQTRYRGFVREHRTATGERYPALVLFEDRNRLIAGLPIAEFNLKNLRARLLEREPDTPLVRRVSPEPRTRLEDTIQDGFERVLTAFRANRGTHQW
jgi:hypothetical protein